MDSEFSNHGVEKLRHTYTSESDVLQIENVPAESASPSGGVVSVWTKNRQKS